MIKRFFRIHGDNIIECVRTLNLISRALDVEPLLLDSSLHNPIYSFYDKNFNFEFELLSGHGRWGIDIGEIISERSGFIRETADSYISEIINDEEKFILAIEYCSALPAGNNAWQRNGRALSSLMCGIPYLYIAELGGVELDANRNVKAPRYPNPIVPFSYLCANRDYPSFCLPIYLPHPSISNNLYKKFSDNFGGRECELLINALILQKDLKNIIKLIEKKSLSLIKILSNDRKGNNTLKGEKWDNYLKAINRPLWVLNNSDLGWKKKFSEKLIYQIKLGNYLIFLIIVILKQ